MCRTQAAQLRREKDRLDAAGLRIVLIGLGTPDEARSFRDAFNLPFTVLCDPEQRIYRLYGLGRTDLAEELKPGALIGWVPATVRYGMGSPGRQDATRLGGTFVVGRDGKVRYAFRAQRMRDRADIGTLVRVATS